MTHPTQRALEEVGWLRQLALSIVRDAHEADDAVQEAWVRALRGQAGDVRDARAWWGTILRRSWSTKRRDAGRRRAREVDVARPEAQTDTTEVVQRMQEQRLLLDSVESLEEPYRTTILLRFFEDLPPRAIAERMGTPVATVHTRQKRALELLRAKLERRHGSRDAWLAALAPIAALPRVESNTVPWLSFLGMKTQTKFVVAACAVLAGLGGLWFASSTESSVPPEAVESVRSVSEDPGRAGIVVTTTSPAPEARTVASLPAAPAAPIATSATPTTRLVRGRVLDPEGRPLAGLLVGQERAERTVSARSDANGRFEIALLDAAVLIVTEPGWTTVLYASATGGESAERVLVAARRVTLAGHVISASEEFVPTARVEGRLPVSFRARFPGLLDYSGTWSWSTITDSAGRFSLDDVPSLDGFALEATHHEHGPGELILRDPAGVDATALLVRMTARPTLPDDVVGAVVDARGQPLARAVVAAGSASDTTDAHGQFRLKRSAIGGASEIRAVKAGFLPALAAVPRADEHVLIALSGPAATITGRVVDDAGRPIARAKVWVADPTFFGYAPHVDMDATVEGLAAVELDRADVDRYWKHMDTLDALTARTEMPPLSFWNFARSDEDGRFELTGLSRRDYTLRAMDARTLQIAEVGPLAAESRDVLITLPARDVWPILRGRVSDPAGRPVAGARIAVSTTVLAVPRGEMTTYRGESRGDEAVTDEQGAFELRDVPANAALCLTGDHIRRLEYGNVRSQGLRALVGDRPEAVSIVVEHRFHLRVDVTDRPDLADEASVLDEDGRPLTLERLEGYGSYDARVLPLRGGASDSWNTDARARTLVLRKAGVEVKRVPLHLEPIVENVIRP